MSFYMQNELRTSWQKWFRYNWAFGLFLVLIICIPRFILVLHANKTGSYSSIGIVMLLSAIAPFIFLTKFGRKEIGIRKPSNGLWILWSFMIGLAFSVLLYMLGKGLYRNSMENWYVYIGKSYSIPVNIAENDKLILFIVVAITGMIFSPVGEELFFRGIVHGSIAKSFGDKKASLADSTAFAITHLSHFGIIYISGEWKFFPLPSLIWVAGMFVASRLFFMCKQQSGSIWGAIVCHAAFNLGMTYCIFYQL